MDFLRLTASVCRIRKCLALFARLSRPASHGAALVASSLGYIAAGRFGLSEDDLLDVLSADKRVMAEFREQSPDSPPTEVLPDIVWSRLYLDLAPYLTDRSAHGEVMLGFFHRQLHEVVIQDELASRGGRHHHDALAAYFGRRPDRMPPDSACDPDRRKLMEWPYQLVHADRRREPVRPWW